MSPDSSKFFHHTVRPTTKKKSNLDRIKIGGSGGKKDIKIIHEFNGRYVTWEGDFWICSPCTVPSRAIFTLQLKHEFGGQKNQSSFDIREFVMIGKEEFYFIITFNFSRKSVRNNVEVTHTSDT